MRNYLLAASLYLIGPCWFSNLFGPKSWGVGLWKGKL